MILISYYHIAPITPVITMESFNWKLFPAKKWNTGAKVPENYFRCIAGN